MNVTVLRGIVAPEPNSHVWKPIHHVQVGCAVSRRVSRAVRCIHCSDQQTLDRTAESTMEAAYYEYSVGSEWQSSRNAEPAECIDAVAQCELPMAHHRNQPQRSILAPASLLRAGCSHA